MITFALLLFTAACQNSPTTSPTDPTTAPPATTNESANSAETESGYPAYPASAQVAVPDSAYPVPTPDGLMQELPETTAGIPEPEADFATIGGAIVTPIEGQGYTPVNPQNIYLGEIVSDAEGRPVFLRSKEDGPAAQQFGAGVFIFNRVEPGTYGLVLDLGIGTFPIVDEQEEILLFDVAAGEALDLGVLFFSLE